MNGVVEGSPKHSPILEAGKQMNEHVKVWNPLTSLQSEIFFFSSSISESAEMRSPFL